MSKNKRILNLHELKFAELAVFHENTTMFQANTNASLNIKIHQTCKKKQSKNGLSDENE